ncbi:MAG: DUF72 domain-containing protein [candidate division KSB1 bacterium]|nr:DUF72 domain-containing protein [candidate division KSB1 bacterium]
MPGTEVRIGCCGYTVSRSKYYRTFTVVEIQQTFYQLPQLETAQKWREEAPPGFEFTMKAWQLITHEPASPTYRRLREPIPESAKDRYGSFRPTEEVREAWRRTVEFAAALGATVIVLQCPASFRPTEQNVANLRAFFQAAASDAFRLAWEPRGKWPRDLVAELCGELNLIHCVDPLKDEAISEGPCYYRLHGRTGYRYVHTEEDFAEVRAKLRPGVVNYVMFNNVQMFDDAQRFAQYLQDKGIP